MTFVMAQDPTKRAAKQKDNTKFNNNKDNNNITTNNTTTITPNDTEFDQNPEDYKSNHNK
jgi:hypothetical protein